MPNWSNNLIAFKGEESNILNMLNDALINSGEEKCESVGDAINSLHGNAKHKGVENGEVIMEKGLRLRTFLPMPDIFLLYDTTNFPEKYEEMAAEQKEKYGVVGWYDYNLVTLGCKWDSELSLDSSFVSNGIATIVFFCETPWSYPENWLLALEEKYGVKAFICTKEEGGFYYFYGTLTDPIDVLAKEEGLYKKYIKGVEEEDYDAYYEDCEELWNETINDFYRYVEEH